MKTSNFKSSSRTRLLTSSQTTELFTTRATLCAVGIKPRELKILETIGEHVRVAQKTVKHTPLEKLTDAFIALLAGAPGLCEINTRARAPTGHCKKPSAELRAPSSRPSKKRYRLAPGKTSGKCATLSYAILKKCGRTFSHPYEKKLQLLDADMSGLPCGPKAELATRGYFPKRYECHGRQLARATSALYHEVITDVVCPGNVQLRETLCPLVELTEAALELNAEKRRRTVWRVDAGVGGLRRANWLLARGYQIHLKDCSSKRAEAFAQTVNEWHRDPNDPEREFGWATGEKLNDPRRVRWLILRFGA